MRGASVPCSASVFHDSHWQALHLGPLMVELFTVSFCREIPGSTTRSRTCHQVASSPRQTGQSDIAVLLPRAGFAPASCDTTLQPKSQGLSASPGLYVLDPPPPVGPRHRIERRDSVSCRSSEPLPGLFPSLERVLQAHADRNFRAGYSDEPPSHWASMFPCTQRYGIAA